MKKSLNRIGIMSNKSFKKSLSLAAVAALSAMGYQSSQAAVQYWDTSTTANVQAGSGTFGASTWTQNGTTLAAFTTGNNAILAGDGATASNAVLTNAGADAADSTYTVTMGAAASALTLSFNNTGYNLIGSGAQTLTLTVNNSTGSNAVSQSTAAVFVAAGKTAHIGSGITLLTNSASFGTAIGLDNGATLNLDAGSIWDRTANAGRDNVFRVTNGATATVNLAGTVQRTVASDTGQITIGGASSGATSGTLNFNVNSGGLITTAGTGASNNQGSIAVGVQANITANLNINNGGTVTASDANTADASAGIKLANIAGSTGTVTLNTGGALNVQKVFAGAGTSTFNFNGGTLKPIVNTTAFMNGLTTANIQAGGAKIDTNGFNVTVGQNLLDGTGGGGLTKNGAGTLTLSNTGHTYTGATTVSNGVLNYSSSANSTITSNATSIAGGAGLGLRVTTDGSTTRLSTNNGNLSFGSGATSLAIDFGGQATPTGTIISTGTGSLTLGGTTTLSFANVTNLTNGTFPLIDYSGAPLANLSGFSATSYTLAGHTVASLINNTANTSVDVQIAAAPIYWRGNVNTNWDIAATSNWDINSGTSTQYLQPTAPGDTVIFDDSASGSGAVAVNVTTAVSPQAVTFNNITRSYTLSGTGNISGTTGITKTGAGTVTLNTANTYTGATTVNEGELVIGAAGAINAANTANVSLVSVATAPGLSGTLTINGGTVNATRTTAPSVVVGNATGGGTGTLNMNSGTLNATQEIWISPVSDTIGTFNLNGGTVNSPHWFVVARNGDGSGNDGTFNQTGGTLNVTGDNFTMASFTGANGQATISGGTTNVTNAFYVGEAGNGTLTMSGTGALNISGTEGLRLGRNTGGTGIVYLDGGTISTRVVNGNAATSSAFYFNGGTLKAAASSTAFITNITVLQTRTGGAVIDSNGFDVTIGQSISEDGSFPGGGLTKQGAGILTLTSGNSFTGATNVTGGALALTTSGDVNSSSGININGGKLVQTSSTTVNPTITLVSGTLDGTTTVSAVNVTGTNANTTIANGNGASNTALTTGNLTFGAGGSTFALRIPGGATTNAVGVNVNGTITTGGVGTVKVNLTPTTSLVSGTMYDLIGVTGGSPTISAFGLGSSFTNRELGSTFVWDSVNNAVALNYVGDSVKWTGAGNNSWALGLTNNNWKLATAGTVTNYLANDRVIFDDSATGSTSIDITTANVAPNSVNFRNNVNYTIGSTGGFGISGTAGLSKVGSGTTTLTSANTYTGATTVNAGTLKLDFSAATPTSNLISASSALSLGGGNLTVIGKASTTNSQTVASTTLNLGGSVITVTDDVTANSTVLNLGAINRGVGAAATFNIPAGTQSATNGIVTTTANTNGIIGPWAVVNNAGAYSYATNSTNNVIPYAGGTSIVNMGGTFVATTNYDVNNTAVTTDNRGVSPSLNTARFLSSFAVNYNANAGATNSANGYMTVGTGGLNLGGAGNVGIGSNNELVLAAYGSGINVTAPVINNGANTSRLITMGTNTVTLSGTSTYTGATVVAGGTTILSGTGSVNTSSGITINGAGAKLVQASSTAVSPVITLKQGTLDGSGSVGDVNVDAFNNAVVANGNGGVSTLATANLTFAGSAMINARVASPSSTAGITTGTLTTNSANGKVTINAFNPAWSSGQFNLVSYSSYAGTLASDFTFGSFTGGGSARASVSGGLQTDGTNIFINVTTDAPKWTGALSSAWNTSTLSAPKNWKLQTAGTTTDYIDGDSVLFDDTATGSTTADISTANITPSLVTFNNSSKNYTITSSGSFGITGTGAVAKSGSGSVQIDTANTYSGGTTLNAGTLKLNNASAIGTGTLAISGGTIDTVSALTLTTNNAQIWSGDFAFGGTNDLSLGNGVVTITGGDRTVTLSGSKTLGTGRIASTVGGLSVTGTGKLAITTTVASNISGALNVDTNATLQINTGIDAATTNDFFAASLTGAGTIVNGGGTERWLYVNGTADSTFSGKLQDGSTGPLGLNKQGTGTLTVSGTNNTYTGATNIVNNGVLKVTGSITNSSTINVGSAAGAAVLQVASTTPNPLGSANIQLDTTGNASTARIEVSGGTTLPNTIGMPGRNSSSVALESTAGNNTLSGLVTINSGGSNYWIQSDTGSDLTMSGGITSGATLARTITLQGDGDGTVSGAITKGSADTMNLTKAGNGTWTLSGVNTYNGATTANSGKLRTVTGVKNNAAMNINNGAMVEVPLSGATAAVTEVSSINTSGTGSHIELHDNDLIINYGANTGIYTDTVNKVKSGLALLGGTGTEGISSAEVDAQTVQGTILAVVDDGDANIGGAITSTSGYTLTAPTTSVIVKFTWFGDSNLDGAVDGSDYALLDSGFTSGGSLGGWVFGDYDYSGTVDGSDYALIDTGFISQNAVLPEPTTLGLLGLGAMGVLRRRRRT